MIEKLLQPVLQWGTKVIAEVGKSIAKEGAKEGIKIAGVVMGMIATSVVASMLTSNYKDKVFKDFLKKHDKETAERLSVQFNSKIENLQKNIDQLKLNEQETKKRFKEGIEKICREYDIDPKDVLKK